MTTANLTIQDNDTVIQYTATAAQTIFPYDFPILDQGELRVSVDQVDKTLSTDYTVDGVGDAGGGNVTFVTPMSGGEIVTLWLDMDLKRLTGFQEGAATLLGTDLNTEFVRQVRHDQMLRRDIRRALRLAPDDPNAGQDMELPTSTSRAGKFLAFNAGGAPIASDSVGGADATLRSELADAATAGKGFNLVARTKRLAEAGVTVVNPQWPYGDPRRFAVVGDGVTDDTAALKVWASTAADYAYFRGEGTYRLESTVTDPDTALANQHGLLFEGLTGLVLDLSAITFVQTVSSSGAVVGGVIALKDCVDCTVIARSTGYNDVTEGLESSSTVVLIGACTGCRVVAHQKGGGRGAAQVRSNDLTNSGDLPQNNHVTSISDGSTRGFIAVHAGAGNRYDVIAKDCRRSFFVDGAHGPGYATLVSEACTTSDIRLRANDANSVIEGLTIDAAIEGSLANQLSIALSTTSTEKGTIRNVTIRGYGTSKNTAGTAVSLEITQFEDASSVLENLDLSGYTIYHDRAAARAWLVQPDDASGIIKRLKLPKVISGDNCAVGHALIDNTVGCTIDGVKVGDIHAGAAAGSWQCLTVTGVVKNLDLRGVELDQAGGSSSFSASGANCDGVDLTGAISPRGLMNFTGSTRVIAAPARISQGGSEGPVVVAALADNSQMNGVTTWVTPSGSQTVNELNWGHIGQVVTIVSTGGTQTLVDSAQILTIGGANIVLGTDADAVSLVCVDETPGTNVWRQVA